MRTLAFCWLVSGIAWMLSGCDASQESLRLVGTLERDRIEIVAETAEPIVAIEVREGQTVEMGQVLLRQADDLVAARLAQAAARVNEARHRLTELERGARVETLDEARARVEAARAALQRDERELRRVMELVDQRLVSQSRADEARAARDRSQAALREAQAQLTALVRGTRTEQIDQARAALAAAESAQRELAVTDARLVVRATRNGIVEALPYELGERPPAGNTVAVLLADSAPFARVYVPEPVRARIRHGTRMQVHVDGVAEPLSGVVRFISGQASFTPYFALTQRDRSRLNFLAEVELTEPRARELPAGVPVEATLADEPADPQG